MTDLDKIRLVYPSPWCFVIPKKGGFLIKTEGEEDKFIKSSKVDDLYYSYLDEERNYWR